MRATFMYADSGISPHPVHRAWAMSLCQNAVKTPKGFGKFDVSAMPKSDVLLLESLYCLPFAKAYKKRHPCKIIAIIDDTSFWNKKLSVFRKLYFRTYLGCVDGFVFASERIASEGEKIVHKPYALHRPFILINKHRGEKRTFNKNILFIGNDAPEKGYRNLIEAMRLLPEFELYLVGNCGRDIGNVEKNVHIEGRVPKLEKYFDMCTYYVHPADFEPFGVAPAEAMYAGLLPLLTKNVGLAELFKKDMKLFVLSDNKPETIASEIRKLSELPDSEKRKLSKRCSDFAKTGTDMKKNVKEFKKKVISLLEDL